MFGSSLRSNLTFIFPSVKKSNFHSTVNIAYGIQYDYTYIRLLLLLLYRGVQDPEISGHTKFFQDRDRYPKISRFSNLSGFLKKLGFGKGLETSLNKFVKAHAFNCIERSQI